MICVGARSGSSAPFRFPSAGTATWLTTAASDVLVSPVWKGCPHFLQNLASSRLRVSHDGQIICCHRIMLGGTSQAINRFVGLIRRVIQMSKRNQYACMARQDIEALTEIPLCILVMPLLHRHHA